ncbi:MAG: hypothetical protein NTY12_05500 [Candidatus Falkowbacteria bacterium]|nr:hypothetical protein [Candidatus Falkowbacteria bacterium]
MKSIHRRYKNIEIKNPGYSSYICFTEAVVGRRFSTQTISRWFNRLVSKDDYASSDKKDILKHLVRLSNSPTTTKNKVKSAF